MKIVLICLLIKISFVFTDLPTNCKKSQIVGTWSFDFSVPVEKDLTESYKHICGHKVPSNERTSYKVVIKEEDYPYKNIIIELNEDDSVEWGERVNLY
jgi:hypothetical protein